MSSSNLPAGAPAPKLRKKPQPLGPLSPDIHQKLGWSVEETMALTHQGRPAVIKKIKDCVYRSHRGPRDDYIIDPQSVREDVARQFDQPLAPPSVKRPGRPRKAVEAAPKPKRAYRRKAEP
jgi:hypothetical protein